MLILKVGNQITAFNFIAFKQFKPQEYRNNYMCIMIYIVC